jgi:hypothetical protein
MEHFIVNLHQPGYLQVRGFTTRMGGMYPHL